MKYICTLKIDNILNEMKTRIIFLALLFSGAVLSAQGSSDIAFDFGLKTGIKWYNGKSVKMTNPNMPNIKQEVYPHVHYPKLTLDFTAYPRTLNGNVGFESMISYYQFSGTIKMNGYNQFSENISYSNSNNRLNASDYLRDVISFQENVKYTFAIDMRGAEFVFEPYVGLGVSRILGKSDFYVTNMELNDENGFDALGEEYKDGLVPIYNTEYDLSKTAFNMAFGIDFEVRANSFGFLLGFGYDLGINNFYKQKLEYLYYGQAVRKETLKFYNSGFHISLGLKYLFR